MTATSYVDTVVTVGNAFEYRVVKTAETATTNYTAEGYIYSGIRFRFTDSRGKLVLIVDNTHAAALAVELARLERDLVGDGWTLIRHDVSRSASVVSVGNLIKADYNADPSGVRAVFLFGHVPVPYSGELNPDGHPDHRGAWPADAYYGDVDGTWTDATVNNGTADSERNRNRPNDGKFDQSTLPSPLELQVGRVDLSNLPTFQQSEVELLRRYLNKDHAFRHRRFQVPTRAFIDDEFGVFDGEAFAANGWRNFPPLCGRANVSSADWLTVLPTQSYLLAYGCGGGRYVSADGVTTTAFLAALEQRVVFTLLLGSYFGDWDSTDNLMRAVLASSPFALMSGWAGRPDWQIHHMGLGETIGFSTRVTQNNPNLYVYNLGLRGVHVALMGDPTLRLLSVAPPSGLIIRANTTGGLRLTWAASSDAVDGYHVYRGNSAAGPFVRITSAVISTNEFVDPAGAAQTYLVRAVKLETTGSGSYFNLSQGVFQDALGSFGPPPLAIQRGPQGVTLSWPVAMLGYRLEAISSLGSGVWDAADVPLQTNSVAITATVPTDANYRYFRLSEW
jgi:hypothetical protein